MKNVLVIGATGFLGSHLVRELNERGISVSIYRRLESSLQRLRGRQFEEFTGALDDVESLGKALKNCDTIFYLAACISLLNQDRANCRRVNVEQFQTALSVIESRPKIRLVYCSSVGALGLSERPVHLSEADNGKLFGITYFESKRKAEELVLNSVSKGLDAVIVNPATVLGPDMRESQQRVIRQLAKGGIMISLPGGTCFCDVRDVCRGMAVAAEKGKTGERYILGGHNLSYREYFHMISRLYKKKGSLIPAPGFILPVLGMVCEIFGNGYGKDTGIVASHYGFFSSKKAENDLGYQVTPMEEIIRRIGISGD